MRILSHTFHYKTRFGIETTCEAVRHDKIVLLSIPNPFEVVELTYALIYWVAQDPTDRQVQSATIMTGAQQPTMQVILR